MVIANSALRASLAIYHLISKRNARSWNNCFKNNRTGTSRGVRLPNSIDAITSIVWQKDKTHPVSIESERSPSGMYLKQFQLT